MFTQAKITLKLVWCLRADYCNMTFDVFQTAIAGCTGLIAAVS
jgi:hypothetical protein